MPRRSNRLIYCYWDDRDESLLGWARRPQGTPEFPPWPGCHSMNLYEPRDRAWLGKVLTKITPDQAKARPLQRRR